MVSSTFEYAPNPGSPSLRYAVLDNARVVPTAVSSGTGSVRGGIVGQADPPSFIHQRRGIDGNVSTITRFRHNDPTGYFDDSQFETLPGITLYLGPLHRHFGHFITESLTRIWFHLANVQAVDQIIAIPEVDSVNERESFSYDSLLEWQRSTLEYFDLSNLRLVTRPLVCETLVVPEQGAILFSDQNSRLYLDILENHARSAIVPSATSIDRVFLTRPSGSGGIAGEEYIAKFFESNGYQTVAPENLSVREQLELVHSSKHIVATQGSALHLLNLLGNNDTRVLVFRRTNLRALRAFLKSLSPYVDSVFTVEKDGLTMGAQTTMLDLRLLDVEELFSQAKSFDPSIDIESFDWIEYWNAVLVDVAEFLKVGA